MTLGKMTAWAAVLAIPCLLWAWIGTARNGPTARTRFLVKQVQHINVRYERAEQSLVY
jgi:hypothetical protein